MSEYREQHERDDSINQYREGLVGFLMSKYEYEALGECLWQKGLPEEFEFINSLPDSEKVILCNTLVERSMSILHQTPDGKDMGTLAENGILLAWVMGHCTDNARLLFAEKRLKRGMLFELDPAEGVSAEEVAEKLVQYGIITETEAIQLNTTS